MGLGAVPPHVVVPLYAPKGGLAALRQQVELAACAQAFALLRVLDTTDMGGTRAVRIHRRREPAKHRLAREACA